MDKEIIYCRKCHVKKRDMSYEKAVEAIRKIYPDYKVIDQCMSTCGLGKKQYFMEKEDEIIMADSFEQLLEEE